MPDEPNLFGVKVKAKRLKAPPAQNGAVQHLIGVFCGLFVTRFNGERPVITPRDGKALKQLVTSFGPEKVEQRLPLYLALDDAYVSERGYPLSLLPGVWNRLTAQMQQRRKPVLRSKATASVQDALMRPVTYDEP